MCIKYHPERKVFELATLHTSYQIQISELGHLIHLYYGATVNDLMDYLFEPFDAGFSPNPYAQKLSRGGSLDLYPMEYSGINCGDFRVSSLDTVTGDGVWGADLRYLRHEIKPGKYGIKGMPSSRGNDENTDSRDVQTLRITLADAVSGLEVELLYAVFEDKDVITRAARITNTSNFPIHLHKAASCCLDLPEGDWDLIHFHGRHTMERQTQRNPVLTGIHRVSSKRGASSHQQNPFVILCDRNTTEDAGDCYGMMLVYSGNHCTDVEKDQSGCVRCVMGISSEQFLWELMPGQSFDTPEVLMTYSKDGIGRLSRQYHRFIRENICKSKYMHQRRPVLINNWEATYFDFDADKILKIASQAAELGVEMIVLDDGWFGSRFDDNSGLGDWYVNETKLPGGLTPLIDRINEMGMKFGIWVEPEMVNEDSDLFRAHPGWAFTIPGREPSMSRNQLVLDLSRKDVVDWLYKTLSELLTRYNIEYVKWDMNRHLTDVYSRKLPAERQGEVFHRYVLGLYDLLERLTNTFPDVLFEGCSGGGGRFDAAMLHYSPQIWCSDDTDAIERLYIQEGTSYGYPASAVGAHVSAVPNHQTSRSTPFGTRGVAAMYGGFGYELDLSRLSAAEKEEVRGQIRRYHEYYDLIHNGDYYRLTTDSKNRDYTAWQFVSPDFKGTLVSAVMTSPRVCLGPVRIRLKGLDPKASYEIVRMETFGCKTEALHSEKKVFSGEALLEGGIVLPIMHGDYPGVQIYLNVPVS